MAPRRAEPCRILSLSTEFDCTRCGACCFSSNPHYIRLLPQDEGRPVPAASIHDHGDRRYLDMACGRCSFFTMTADGLSLCRIYEDRPEACRAFRAGSFECLMARKHKGAEADAVRLVAMMPAPVPSLVTAPALSEAGMPAFIAAETLGEDGAAFGQS